MEYKFQSKNPRGTWPNQSWGKQIYYQIEVFKLDNHILRKRS